MTFMIVTPELHGAKPGQDATKAFQAMFDDITKKMVPDKAGTGVPVQSVVVFLSDSYTVSDTITTPFNGRAQGLTIMGTGKRSSEIVMTAPKPLFINNNQWMGVRFYNTGFRSTTKGASFLYSISTGNAQDWGFENVEWRGTWKYGIGLDGPATSNCNSEFYFNNCQIGGSYEDAFLHSGMSPQYTQQDQFLNYWFNDCKVEYQYGDFLRFDRGGSIKVSGGSYILEGTRPDGSVSRFFNFPVAGHADSVQKLSVRDVRFELRNATHKVIESHWTGQIVFDNCTDTALGFQSFSTNLVAHEYWNPGMVRFASCDLVGKHSFHQQGLAGRQQVVYDMCTRKNNRNKTFLTLDGKINVFYRNDGDGLT